LLQVVVVDFKAVVVQVVCAQQSRQLVAAVHLKLLYL
jgi:hypothetical protein